ncbi:hypothetical protein SCLCIDRAFT_1208183 [Scleroderma citrinum Foug A]|uniref:Uncharacterized protein n=1 Tax=Scleroderma citrinum Foug A TaxID=1036808 RepID=A0A0C3EPD5_9AGAM|nr:hypothetical protein SCLCIDRAFT_1208183 [Scleroderma citrinum Foug A]
MPPAGSSDHISRSGPHSIFKLVTSRSSFLPPSTWRDIPDHTYIAKITLTMTRR